MLRSLYSGVSGMKSNQVKMDVIGNNIANVNTTAFKSSRVKFQETLSNTMSTALGPDITGKGAKNPKQVGLGTTVSSIDTMTADGVHQPTGRELDFAIQMDGFFVVSDEIEDGSAPSKTSFTRDGSFYRDSQGTLVNSSGDKVMGYASGAPDTTAADNAKDAYTTLTNVIAAADLAAAKTAADAAGIATTIKDAASAAGDTDLVAEAEAAITAIGAATTKEQVKAAASIIADIAWELSVSAAETIADPEKENLRTLEIPTKFVVNNITGQLQKDAITGRYKETAGTDETVITLDTFNVDATGLITAIGSDQNSYKIGRLAIAKFKNTEGLTKEGSNTYGKTANSGEPIFGIAGYESFGTITQGALEVSNVDLANEFTEMIITSRAYQANSRSITTSDEMLQELLSLKR